MEQDPNEPVKENIGKAEFRLRELADFVVDAS